VHACMLTTLLCLIELIKMAAQVVHMYVSVCQMVLSTTFLSQLSNLFPVHVISLYTTCTLASTGSGKRRPSRAVRTVVRHSFTVCTPTMALWNGPWNQVYISAPVLQMKKQPSFSNTPHSPPALTRLPKTLLNFNNTATSAAKTTFERIMFLKQSSHASTMFAHVHSKLSTMASVVHHYGSIFLWMLLFAIVACLGFRAIVIDLRERRLQSLTEEDESWC